MQSRNIKCFINTLTMYMSYSLIIEHAMTLRFVTNTGPRDWRQSKHTCKNCGSRLSAWGRMVKF